MKMDRPILIIIGNNKNGGIARRAASLANGFSDVGIETTVVITKEDSDVSFFPLKELARTVSTATVDKSEKTYKKTEREVNRRIKIIKFASCFISGKTVCGKKLRFSVPRYRKTVALRTIIKSYADPVVIALGFDYAVSAYYAAKGVKCDLIYGTRTFVHGEFGDTDREIVKSVLKGFSCCVSQTGYTANGLREAGAKRVEVIGNPLFVETSPYYGERKDSIVNFCRISPEKRLDLLIDAFSDICADHPEYRIDIYGTIVTEEDEKLKAELLEYIERLGLSDRVAILPARKDIHDVIKDCAMYVSTSEYEGLSNSMLEALALGMPCICTDCNGGGAREMITDGKNGLLIPKNDRRALAEAMRRFITDKSFAAECGKNAVVIRDKLSSEKIALRWVETFDKYCK